MTTSVTRAQVRAFRVRAQQLDRESGAVADTAALNLGVQDTGTDGGLWALANRGVDVAAAAEELATAWSLRGAPHLYRRADLSVVAAAVQPWSDADAGKRIFDAARPLKAAGIANLDALDAVAAAMRDVVTEPMIKGAVSTALATRMPAPYLRYCRSCDATHLYEMPFRLAALRAGLELQAGTSPPVLERAPGLRRARTVPDRVEPVRAYLRLLGPATPKQVAAYVDAPVAEVKARWPADTVEVSVDGQQAWLLAADEPALASATAPAGTRLLGGFDPFLQAKDRAVLIDDPSRAKALWPVLGRPGAVLAGARVLGTWRPRANGRKLTVLVELWQPGHPARAAITEQAERLAAHRQAQLVKVEFSR